MPSPPTPQHDLPRVPRLLTAELTSEFGSKDILQALEQVRCLPARKRGTDKLANAPSCISKRSASEYAQLKAASKRVS